MAEFNVDALRALLAEADGQTAEPTTQEPTDDGTATAEPVQDTTSAVQEQEDTQVDQPDVHVATQQEKDNNAFAQMRVQNKQMQDMLAKIAEANGIQYTDQNDLMNKLNDDSVTKLAASKGMDKETLLRIEALERDANAYRAQQTQGRLVTEMRNLMTEFSLSEQELTSFAQQLDAEHVDINRVNLRNEYLGRNMQSIIDKQVQAAVQAALKGDAEIAAKASTPLAPGASSGSVTGTKVNTVADLRNFLANQASK